MSDQDDMKARIRAATEKYITRNDPNRVHRKNEAPEKELQREVIRWLNTIGFSIDTIQSKATFSEATQSYTSQQQSAGLSDLIGNDYDGHAVYIELKAPGRRTSLRSNQREFLVRKIKTKAFAICADSKDYILKSYAEWREHPNRTEYLLSLLPKEKIDDDSQTLFNE